MTGFTPARVHDISARTIKSIRNCGLACIQLIYPYTNESYDMTHPVAPAEGGEPLSIRQELPT